MGIIFDGKDITTTEPNALTFNNSDVNGKVFFDGVEVWKQVLFSRTWSGDSISGGIGFETSGSLVRATDLFTTGDWLDVDANGKFTIGDSIAGTSTLINFSYLTESTLTIGTGTPTDANGVCNFHYRDGFTGSTVSAGGYGNYLETSGGQLRTNRALHDAGNWVTLT